MTAPNHIAGGIVFTGVFCSLWNVNIFSNQYLLVATVVGSLLPDIDHTKSLIGKCVYPLAKWINQKYGHRTVTHSLLFLFSITVASYMVERFFFETRSGNHVTLILFFSVFSHLLYDMLTVQGVPLFYPFRKNPCVIPGNPEYRIRSGDLKMEGIFFFFFALFALTFQNLFAQGFWTTYNQQFNSIMHTHREFKNSERLLKVEYDFNKFQIRYKGEGFLVYADFQQLYILSGSGVNGELDTLLHLFEGAQGQRIHLLKPVPTKDTLEMMSISINQVDLDSLNRFLEKKYIVHASFFSNRNVVFAGKSGLEKGQFFELKNEYSPYFILSLKDTLFKESEREKAERKYLEKKEEILDKIKERELALSLELQIMDNHKKEREELEKNLKGAKEIIQRSEDNFEINEAKKTVIELEKKLLSFVPKISKIVPRLKQQIAELKKQYNVPFEYSKDFEKKEKTEISCTVQYFKIPKQYDLKESNSSYRVVGVFGL